MTPMDDPTRRGLLEASIFVTGAGLAVALGLPGAAFLCTPLLREGERTWVDLGALEPLATSPLPVAVRFRYESSSGYTVASRPGLLYVVPDQAAELGVRVLSPICTHKGCNVSWSAEEELFACPCHQGRFDAAGAAVSGPPNAPLARMAVRVDDGHLWAELGEAQA
jgi:Rieske Fe-S protein